MSGVQGAACTDQYSVYFLHGCRLVVLLFVLCLWDFHCLLHDYEALRHAPDLGGRLVCITIGMHHYTAGITSDSACSSLWHCLCVDFWFSLYCSSAGLLMLLLGNINLHGCVVFLLDNPKPAEEDPCGCSLILSLPAFVRLQINFLSNSAQTNELCVLYLFVSFM